MSNYLDNSDFGRVAASLLSKRNKIKTRDRNEALALTAVLTLLDSQKQKLKNRTETALTTLNSDYNRDKLSRETMYNKANEGRALFEKYLKNPDGAVVDRATELYNNNEGIKSANVTLSDKSKLTGSAKVLADQLWEKSKETARLELESYRNNPLYTSETFQNYNQAYYDAYKAEIARIKNDPTKKSVIVNAANKFFPSWFDNTIGDLQAEVDLQKANIKNQENKEESSELLISNYLESVPKMSKEESLEFISKEYENILSPRDLVQLSKSIKSKRDDISFTKNDIISVALSNQILNNENLSEFKKEILNETERYDFNYMRNNNLDQVPVEGDENYKNYLTGLNNTIDRNVFNRNPIISKVNDIMELIQSDDKKMQELGKLMMRNISKDDGLAAFQASLITNLMGTPKKEQETEVIIEAEKALAIGENREPRYTNIPEYMEFLISNFLTLSDLSRTNITPQE
tara:strand:+ start:3886 stop:5271 length:1386 start_codon:yes stop_codon:yes gene_type:complete